MLLFFNSTRRFLANAIVSAGSLGSNDDGYSLERYIEQLRKERPIIEWMVQCFHYETPSLRSWFRQSSSISEDSPEIEEAIDAASPASHSSTSPPSVIRKKIITSRATSTYEYKSCIDKSYVGVWRRAACASDESLSSTSASSSSSSSTGAKAMPFAQISLTKLLVLKNTKATKDYTKQQMNFVMKHGQGDQCAEFSTLIRIPNFKSRILVERPVDDKTSSIPTTKLFRLHLFWLFTFLGLTVPYRMWFSDHCDEIRVTIVKELSVDPIPVVESAPSSSFKTKLRWGFFSSPLSETDEECNNENKEDTFRALMKGLQLYATPPPGEISSCGSSSFDDNATLILNAEEQQFENATATLLNDLEAATAYIAGSETTSLQDEIMQDNFPGVLDDVDSEGDDDNGAKNVDNNSTRNVEKS